MPHPSLLFLPGTLCTGAVFARQAEALKSCAGEIQTVEFRLERSIEAMAHTSAKNIPENSRASLVGFSMGGMVAITLAALYPQKVERIALLNSNSHPDLPDRRAKRTKALEAARHRGLRDVVSEKMLPAYLYRQEPEHREMILDMAEEHGLEAFEAQVTALSKRPDLASLLKNLECPVLIVGGREDPLCPPASQQDMFHQARRGKLLMLEQCGHFSVLEKAGEINRALTDWISTPGGGWNPA